MKNITKGQLEAILCEEIAKFEKEFMDRGLIELSAIIIKDAILVRLRGGLTLAETHLAKTSEGVELIKKTRFSLLSEARDMLDSIILRITGSKIISLHSDISTKNGESVIVFILDHNLGSQLKANNQIRSRFA